MERQLDVFLGPQPSREDLRHLTFSFANVMAHLTGGEPLSLEYLIRSAPIVPPFGLRNNAETVGHLVAQRMPPSPTNDEFMGMTEYIMECPETVFVDLMHRVDRDRTHLGVRS